MLFHDCPCDQCVTNKADLLDLLVCILNLSFPAGELDILLHLMDFSAVFVDSYREGGKRIFEICFHSGSTICKLKSTSNFNQCEAIVSCLCVSHRLYPHPASTLPWSTSPVWFYIQAHAHRKIWDTRKAFHGLGLRAAQQFLLSFKSSLQNRYLEFTTGSLPMIVLAYHTWGERGGVIHELGARVWPAHWFLSDSIKLQRESFMIDLKSNPLKTDYPCLVGESDLCRWLQPQVQALNQGMSARHTKGLDLMRSSLWPTHICVTACEP